MNPSNDFRDDFYKRWRLIDEACMRRQTLGAVEHAVDDFTNSMENLEDRDFDIEMIEELYDFINYAKAKIILMQKRRERSRGETGSTDGCSIEGNGDNG